MADVPAWLVTARNLKGTLETPGSADTPAIMTWPRQIAERWPEMAAYTRGYTHDSIAWCGLFVAYCVSANGIKPPFDPDVDTDSFLWANAWSRWGTKLNTPKPGCIMVFTRNGGGHVGFYEREDDDYYYITGGNQSDSVSTAPHSKDTLTAAVWPPAAEKLPAAGNIQVEAQVDRFEECIPITLEWEGGYGNDPRDPGGPTNFGITLEDYQQYLDPSGGASDVRNMSKAQAKAIFRKHYWDQYLCGQMPAGVDLAVFDFRVNSGGGIRVVQRVVGTDPDGEVGPLTLAALAAVEPRQLINDICDARMSYLRGLSGWPTFGNGWGKRVVDVRAKALAMVSKEPLIVPKADPSPLPQTTPQQPGINPDIIKQLLETIVPIAMQAAQQAAKDPAIQQAAKSAFSVVLPKLLGLMGMSVPGIGVLGMVASYVIPALLPDLMGTHTPTAVTAFAGSAGVFGLGVVNMLKSALDRIGVKVE